ncbi:endopeptidase La [candidate division KSB1 bacterium 4572_119]|nr:MAG: endopeptidase La [candidate division KSB1 bacterium 4572_119]
MYDGNFAKLKDIDEIENITIPEQLPVLPLRDFIIYPHMVSPLIIARDKSLKMIEDVMQSHKLICLVAQKDPENENPDQKALFKFGTVAFVLKMLRFPDNSVRILVQGLSRIKVQKFTKQDPYFVAKIKQFHDNYKIDMELDALIRNISNQFQKIITMVPNLSDELQIAVMNVEDPGRLADLLVTNLNLTLYEKQEILELVDIHSRLKRLTFFVNREIQVLEMGSKIQTQVQTEIGKNQREYYLKEQLKAIQRELGETDERTSEINDLRKKIEEAGMPESAQKEADRELDRLTKIPVGSAEYTVSRTYLDWLVNIPWNRSTTDNLDIESAEKILNEDHYNLLKVKERILEFLAVRKLKQDMKGPILCFVGPPGVGKTSLGRSIARALNRKFIRISLGGVRDEAEIRGHRRTYIGALPGRIIQGLKNAQNNNPVFMLDEIDKIGQDFRGDPSSALLEVLDPEQNFSFSDHYLDVPFDLSKVLFITTANYLDPIPPALMDRMEVIELPGYTEEEKTDIAFQYLIPKQLMEHGLKKKQASFHKSGIKTVISEYTLEAGLRNLEREIAKICRKIAKRIASGNNEKAIIKKSNVSEYLGPEKYFSEVADRLNEPGIATGLAWTPFGGDILFIECTHVDGEKGFLLTGQMGDVMKESAQAALTYVKARAKTLRLKTKLLNSGQIHIHVPAGGIPKDGPSAGITMVIALISLLKNQQVKKKIALTGEITLRGKVLPIGGVKEKILAARRAGIKEVILPEKNKNDVIELPDIVKKEMELHYVEKIDQAVNIIFPPKNN